MSLLFNKPATGNCFSCLWLRLGKSITGLFMGRVLGYSRWIDFLFLERLENPFSIKRGFFKKIMMETCVLTIKWMKNIQNPSKMTLFENFSKVHIIIFL
jgi:hypothetical protein